MIQSAGLLVFKINDGRVRVLLTHPGGPIWGKRDTWSIPKGELDEGEDHFSAALREFREEVGVAPPKGRLIDLGMAKQGSVKVNYIWAVEGDVDLGRFSSNTFLMEWPPKSGRRQEFPENDKVDWFDPMAAKSKVFKDQAVFFDRFMAAIRKIYPAVRFDQAPPDAPEQSALF